MGRNGLRKKPNHVTDNYDVEPLTSFKKTSGKKNLPTQHVDEPIYPGSVDMVSEVASTYHYGGYFKFHPSREYVSGHLMKTTMDIDFMSYFDMLDDLKKHCKFTILDGDKFFYLKGDKIINDYDGLVEYCDDSDVRDMLSSYKMYKEKPIEIYTLSKNYDVFENTSLEENSYRDNVSEEVNEAVEEEHEPTNPTGSNIVKRKTRGPTRCLKIINLQEGEKLHVEFDEDHQAIGVNATQFIWFLGQTVRSRSCCPLKVNSWKEIEQDKIDHMWDIVLEKFNFDVSEGRKGTILGHMNDLYRDYRHKLKQKYFDTKTTYQLRLRNKPKLVVTDDWKYLVNFWSDANFQKKNGKAPSRVEVFIESCKRKNGKQVDTFQQDFIDQLKEHKNQQKEGEIFLNDDDIFEKVLGTEKNGYLRAYGPGKSISE